MKLSRIANWVGRLSVVRILLAGLALVIAVIARDITVGILGSVLSLGRNTARIWLGPSKATTDASAAAVIYSVSAFLIMVSFGFAAYWLYSRLIERRVPSELAWKSAPQELALGSLIGSGFVLTVVGVLAAFGYFRICGTNPWIAAVPAFSMAATAAFMEERPEERSASKHQLSC